MFERPRVSRLQARSSGLHLPAYPRLRMPLTLLGTLTGALLWSGVAAQTAPIPPNPAQPTTAPTTPAPSTEGTPAPTPAAPSTSTPATPRAAPAPAPAAPGALNVTSALAVEVSGTVKGRLVLCPKALNLTSSAVCLYTKNTLPALRSVLRGKLTGRIVSDWKSGSGDRSSSLVVKAGTQNAFVLLAQLSATETLVVVDEVPRAAAAAPVRPAMPAGIVKGAQYVLDSDLKGLVNVVAVSSGTYRLASVAGGPVLTVTSGKKTATLGGGSVELPLAPVSDGKNLLFPLDALRALACTVAPAQVGVTVACGSASASVRPIVF